MISLLRLLGMIAPIFGVLFFCYFGAFLRSIKDHPLEMPGVLLLFLVLVGSFSWYILCVKSEEKDHRLGVAWKIWNERTRNFLFVPEPGPTGILVTRTPARVHLRLPDEYPPVREPAGLGGFVFFFGFVGVPFAFIVFIVHNNSQAVPPAPVELRDFRSFLFSLPTLALVALLALLGTRFNWHIELVITPAELRLYYVYARFRWRKARIDLTPIRQFTVLRRGAKSALQAEAVDDPPNLLLCDRDHDPLLELANLLTQERSMLDPARGTTRVAVESAPQEIQPERWDRPLNSKIVLTRHDTGITLDFPLTEDNRTCDHRTARRDFKIAIGIWVALFASWGIGFAMDQPGLLVCSCTWGLIPGGIALLVALGHLGPAPRYYPHGLRQLSIADNLLVRTATDQSKRIWYRQEIRTVALVEDTIETTDWDEHGTPRTSATPVHHLAAELHNGEKAILLRIVAGQADYRPKAELEWIATLLRQALYAEAVAVAPPAASVVPDHAIQADETRITP